MINRMLGPYVSYEACGMECDDWFYVQPIWPPLELNFDSLTLSIDGIVCTSWNFKLFFILIEPRITNLTATCFTFSYFIINTVSFLKVNLEDKRKCPISQYRTSLLVFCKNIDMHPSHIQGNVITHKRKLIYLKVLYSFEGTWNLLFPLSKTAKILTATGLLLC